MQTVWPNGLKWECEGHDQSYVHSVFGCEIPYTSLIRWYLGCGKGYKMRRRNVFDKGKSLFE